MHAPIGAEWESLRAESRYGSLMHLQEEHPVSSGQRVGPCVVGCVSEQAPTLSREGAGRDVVP